MKALNKLVITLSLAAPLSLVSADEVVKINAPADLRGTADYSLQTADLAPMDFKDVTVVAPRLEAVETAIGRTVENAVATAVESAIRSPELVAAEETAYRYIGLAY